VVDPLFFDTSIKDKLTITALDDLNSFQAISVFVGIFYTSKKCAIKKNEYLYSIERRRMLLIETESSTQSRLDPRAVSPNQWNAHHCSTSGDN
jgi:hypothetical protein